MKNFSVLRGRVAAVVLLSVLSIVSMSALATTTITNGQNFFFTSSLDLDLGGLVPGAEHDQILATGFVVVGGTLNIAFVDNWSPRDGDAYILIIASEIASLDSANQPLPPKFETVNLPSLDPQLNFHLEFGPHAVGQEALVLSVSSASVVPLPGAAWLAISGLALIARRRSR